MKAIILSAGKGTRMKSDILKVAHAVAGRPIVSYVLDTVSDLNPDNIYMIVGHQADLLMDKIKHSFHGDLKKISYVMQKKQLGTGHAVKQAVPYLKKDPEDIVLVLAGDCPLIEKETLKNLIDIHKESNASATILSAKLTDPASYGRILREKMGTVTGIREAKDCSVEERKITEINTGVYVFRCSDLLTSLKLIKTENIQHEYYLTDVIHILKQAGKVIAAYCTDNSNQAIGINTRMDLAKINKLIYQKNNIKLMENGVTIKDPDNTFIDSTVKIGNDTIIYPFSIIQGNTRIGKHCQIGPHCFVLNGSIKAESVVDPFTKIIGSPGSNKEPAKD
ncbi:bifunctional N-acetylglucosamine-1-phosphate uridyltransferase/glucosamine-1-phosphate acetyltransferase [Thermoproteota archaeon]